MTSIVKFVSSIIQTGIDETPRIEIIGGFVDGKEQKSL